MNDHILVLCLDFFSIKDLLLKICLINRNLYHIISTEYFYEKLLKRDFNSDINLNNPTIYKYTSSFELYKDLYLSCFPLTETKRKFLIDNSLESITNNIKYIFKFKTKTYDFDNNYLSDLHILIWKIKLNFWK